MDKELEDWLKTRPRIIQDLAKRYPTGWYVMTEDAPYGISAPGTKVELVGWNEAGDLIVSVHPKHKTQAGLEHEADLRIEYPDAEAKSDAIIRVVVECKYVEKLK